MEELSAVDYLIEILLTREDSIKTDSISPLISTKPDCDEQLEEIKFVEDNKCRSVKFSDIVTLVKYEDLTEESVPIKNDGQGMPLKPRKRESALKTFRHFCRKVTRRLLFRLKKDTN